jgi:uncharacterized membrane protein HdeD (DUF308 family)
METIASRSWGAVFARGCIAIAFAIVAWTRPEVTLTILLIFFGLYVLGDGIASIVAAVRASREDQRWWPFALEGFLGTVGGVVILFAPAAAAVAVVLVVAIWAIATGSVEVVGALRRGPVGAGYIVLAGLVRIGFGALLLARRHLGLESLLWVMAWYALAHGVLLIGLSLRLRSGKREPSRAPPRVTPQPA